MPYNDGAPENAARNPDGSLQNPAAWGITPSRPPQPGSYDPNNAPSVDWNALQNSGFGGLYNGMEAGELENILANSRRNFEMTGVVDSNLASYLNNRDTGRALGLIPNTGELDMNALFGGLNPLQNLTFGPGNGAGGENVSFQDTAPGATSNINRLMQALGGGGVGNLGTAMAGFSDTPGYNVINGQSVRALQETLLRNGLNNGTGVISAANPGGTYSGANPSSTRFDQTNFNYSAPRATGTGTGATGGAGAPASTTPGAPNALTNGGLNYAYASTAPAGTAGVMNTTNYGTAPAAPILNWGGTNPEGAGVSNFGPGAFAPTYVGSYNPIDNSSPLSGAYVPGAGAPTPGQIYSTPRGPDGLAAPGFVPPASNTPPAPTETPNRVTPASTPLSSVFGNSRSNTTPAAPMRGGTNNGSGMASNPTGYPVAPSQQSNSVAGYGNLLNNLSSGQGLSPTGFMGNRRRANNSMWGR